MIAYKELEYEMRASGTGGDKTWYKARHWKKLSKKLNAHGKQKFGVREQKEADAYFGTIEANYYGYNR